MEITYKKILDILRHFTGELDESWADWLHQVTASINDSITLFNGKMPHDILYGTDKWLPYDVLLQSPIPIYSLYDYVKQLQSFQIIHQLVCEKLLSFQREAT